MKMNGMKRILFCVSLGICLQTASTAIAGTLQQNDIMTKTADGSYVVNTTLLAKSVKGFQDATPLKIYIKNDKIVKVEALENKETPSYFDKVKASLLQKWNNLSVSKVAETNIDGVTGATFSSKAVKENVKRGVAYYLNHKNK